MKTALTLSRIKRAVMHRLNPRAAWSCAFQRQRESVLFTGIAAVRSQVARYASLEHFRRDIPSVLTGNRSHYLVAQEFLDEAFLADPRPKVFFSREPMAHHDDWTLECLQRDELAPLILSFGEEDIDRRMFYVALPRNRSWAVRKLRRTLKHQRPGLCCVVNRYKEKDRLLLLKERIRFIRAMDQGIDIYGYSPPGMENGWLRYPGYRGPSTNKLKTLAGYAFNLCFENCDEDGYITEKIIQALLAGCVPLYWGGGRYLEQTIPSSCFINCKDQDPGAIYQRIRTMPQEEILGYRQAGLNFIASPQADRFTWSYWARLVTQRLLESA